MGETKNTGTAWRWLAVVAVAVLVVAVVSRGRMSSQAGAPGALEFSLQDMNGNTVKLSDFRGKPVLINIWATWCEPCKLEIPELIELQDQYRSKGLTILGVSLDDTPEELRPFAAEYKMNYPILVGRNRDDVLESMGYVDGVPTSILVRRDGTASVRQAGIQTKDWFDRQIRALF